MFDRDLADKMQVVRCTYCNKPLFKSKSGIDMHMKHHQRQGLMNLQQTIDQAKTTRLNLIRRVL